MMIKLGHPSLCPMAKSSSVQTKNCIASNDFPLQCE
jgi:hypothetical protein